MENINNTNNKLQNEAVVLGLGICLPKNSISNQQLYPRVKNFESEKAVLSLEKKGTNTKSLKESEIFDLWVMQMCGIKQRPFVSENEFNKNLEAEHMATIACNNALADAAIEPEEVDHLILSTYSTSRLMPSAACTVAKDAGLKGIGVRTLNGACSGFLDALIDAKIKVESGYYKNVLVVATENMSNKMNYSDPKSAVIFSDGAGACLVTSKKLAQKKKQKNYLSLLGFSSGTTYSEQVYMERKGCIFFNDGPYVQRNAVRTMSATAEEALTASGLNFSRVHCIIPHQANARIIVALDENIKKKRNTIFETAQRGETDFHMVNCIKQFGNLSSATVPVALFDFLGNKGISKLNNSNGVTNFVFTSVGGGYTYSAMVANLHIA